MILESLVYTIAKPQYPVCSMTEVCQGTPSFMIAAPDNFNPDSQLLPPTVVPESTPEVTPQPLVLPPKPQSQPRVVPEKSPQIKVELHSLSEEDKLAAHRAWKYFERNWNPKTGFVNSSDNLTWTTWWDQGSALLGIHAAKQLNLINETLFKTRMNVLLQTLETLSLPKTRLPNKAYSTSTAQMRQLNDTPDPQGKSGWSALDMAGFLLALHVIRSHYPEYRERINSIVARWNLQKLVKDGWLNGGIPGKNGKIVEVQEGRLGYEQYAANSLKFWNINAANALNNPPIKQIQVDGVTLKVDKRDQNNSGATNYLTNEPYLLWGLEIGWDDSIKSQIENLLTVQIQRYKRTGILTSVNEDSLDRYPYFIYYSIYANGKPWNAINIRGKEYPNFRFLSTKAAFAWVALVPNNQYTQKLRTFVQNLSDKRYGYFSGKYENKEMGINTALDLNTNAVILESLLYKRHNKPFL